MSSYRLLVLIIFISVALGISTSKAEGGWELIFQDDFEQGLSNSNWTTKGDGIRLATREGGGKCVQIRRSDELGETYLVREFHGPGQFKFEALIYAENVKGGGPTWTAGQFNAAIVEGGREIAWPKDEFENSFGFTRKEFKTPNLSATRKAKLRIGIQDGTGTICVDNVKAFKWAD
ncbi:hypothetical protein [Candidatus Methylomirabilis sp.]|uniref:hypothetical protein n=1 Tax=Candidatus Methylomirabilis sp. TaxID=2032687 RepID=UPI0030765B06